MSLDSLNANNYVFTSYSIPDVPYISVDLMTVTSAALDSAVDTYLGKADEYASAFSEVIGTREYIVDRLQKDLAGECVGLTSGGINKEANTISLHVKADNVYEVAANQKTLNSVGSVNSIISTYGQLHSSICMNDDNNATSLQAEFAEPVTYDTKFIKIDFGAGDVLFINDAPAAIGTEKKYTAYETSIDNGVYVNTSAYNLGYYTDISVNDSTTVNAWFVRDAGNLAVAYSETIDGTYTAIAQPESSSEEPESSTEPESSSESDESSESEQP